MPGMEGNPGISIPRIGGRDIPPLPPPSIEDMLLLPPIKLMPPIPPMLPIEPMEGIAPPPEDIMVEEEEDDEVDLKLEIVLPSSDCVVAAMLWLLAFSSF